MGYGTRTHDIECYSAQYGFPGALAGARLPFVMALKPRRGTWGLRLGCTHTGRWAPGVIEADQPRVDGAGAAVGVEVDTGLVTAEQCPVSGPVCMCRYQRPGPG